MASNGNLKNGLLKTDGSNQADRFSLRPRSPKPYRLNSFDETRVGVEQSSESCHEENGLGKDLVTVDVVRQKAFKWCQDSIGGAWAWQKPEDLIIKPISGGMTNYLFLICLPEGSHPLHSEPSEVLLRIYGQISKSTLDFLVHNSVVFALLAERNLGPVPYGMYHDGRIEEYIKAKTLGCYDVCQPEVMNLIAGKLAQFHGLNMPLSKRPAMFKTLVRGWIADINNNLATCQAVIDAVCKISPSFDINTEFQRLIKIASDLKAPVVFCHNDLQGGNVLLASGKDGDSGRMTIIDWEYAHYNYRGYDFGNHFNEWMYDYSITAMPGYKSLPDKYPNKEQQYCFFTAYLKAQGKENVTSHDLHQMYKEANTLAMHSHFLWGIWSLVQALTSTIDFDYQAYALVRFVQYFKLKRKLPDMLAVESK